MKILAKISAVAENLDEVIRLLKATGKVQFVLPQYFARRKYGLAHPI